MEGRASPRRHRGPATRGGNVRREIAAAVAVGMALAWASVAGARALEVASAWPQVPLRVDGSGDQWAGHLVPVPDQPILLGVENDGSFLYLCLKTSDPKIKGLIRHLGLTVWVNGAGKEKRTYGVRFPVATGFRGERGGSEPAVHEGTARDLLPDTSQIELIGPTDEDRLLMDRTSADPVQAAFGDEEGVWVIEVRLPLQPSDEHPLAVSAAPGARIAVGLETEKPQYRRSGGERGGEGEQGEGGEGGESGGNGGWGRGGGMGPGGWGGGMGGHAGGHGGGMGREGGGRGAGTAGLLKVWSRVTLVSAPAGSPNAK